METPSLFTRVQASNPSALHLASLAVSKVLPFGDQVPVGITANSELGSDCSIHNAWI
jgi:hypothetical protein